MSPPRISAAGRAVAAAVALGALLAACSDVYFDRRETVALSGGDAIAANQIGQMVDPWPPYSNNNNLAFNGERMQRAVECYRKNRVSQPLELDAAANIGVPTSAPTSCQGAMATGSAPTASGAGSGDSR